MCNGDPLTSPCAVVPAVIQTAGVSFGKQKQKKRQFWLEGERGVAVYSHCLTLLCGVLRYSLPFTLLAAVPQNKAEPLTMKQHLQREREFCFYFPLVTFRRAKSC